ncbi:MAG: DUF1926 domain-containing protein [Treponema sp.]|nr:DUF1926 domain-containing protein [Treponema sp.]
MDVPLTLIIGSHNHVPYGIGDEEIENFYCKKLKPFITVLNKFPNIQAVLYHSGFLFQWLSKTHSEYISLLEVLAARKQVELLGGAFYEPLLPLLPLTDKLGQIELMTTYHRKVFGKRPHGCWLPALAWDQSLAGVLYSSGIGYTFLREEQFALTGLSGEALYYPHLTEDMGKIITVFPISSRLSGEFAPGRLAKAVKQFAREIPAGGKRIVSVFPEQWRQGQFSPGKGDIKEIEADLFSLFEELSQCESYINFSTPAKIYRNRQGLAKAYFSASFEGETPLSSGAGIPQIDFSPRQFLITYPEANGIYAKIIFTHVLINQLRGDKSRKRSAREMLWKAQSIDSIYRRPEGGIYRNMIRNAAYRTMLSAEKATREEGVFIPSLVTMDFDLDGEDEYLFQDEHINCYVKAQGAGIFELDYLPKPWNYLATLNVEHSSRKGSAGNCHIRTGFSDFLSPLGFPIGNLASDMPAFPGRRCTLERYEAFEADKAHKQLCFHLLPNAGLPLGSVEIEKTYRLEKDTLSVEYLLSNRGGKELRFNFILRLDLSFPGEGKNYQRILKSDGEKENALPDAGGTISNTKGIEFWDIKNDVILSLESKLNFDACILPIRVSCPVYGMETPLYQFTCALLVTPVFLKPGASWKTTYLLKFSSEKQTANRI